VSAAPLKRTPLHAAHVAAGARMVPFGGWDMPVQYTGILEEHRTVRGAVGLFDVSHMGEFECEGPAALAALQSVTTNDVAALEIGQIQYSVFCYPDGTIVDDLTVYRLAADRYMLTVNASNIDKDYAWVSDHAKAARWENVSEQTGLIAVQGPKAEGLVGRLADRDVTAIGYYHFARGAVAGVATLISRTGYTGEDGFELYTAAADTPRLWAALLDAGRADGVAPIGLGARDTLRLEMKYALYGNDIDDTTNPLEAGLGWVVKLGKAAAFTGKAALEKIKAEGVKRKLVGFDMVERGIPRHGYKLVDAKTKAEIGITTSGTQSPSLDRPIGVGYVAAAHAAIGSEIAVEIRGEARRAKVVETPFYKRGQAK
jgi:aminomethyltransferase